MRENKAAAERANQPTLIKSSLLRLPSRPPPQPLPHHQDPAGFIPDPMMRPAIDLVYDSAKPLHIKLTGEARKLALQEAADQSLKDLAESISLGKSEVLTVYLRTMARFHSYSFNNQILIALQNPDATHVAGFHRWLSLGRFVKKGEHGITIFAPITRRVGEVEEKASDGTASKREVRKLVNTKAVFVFDIAQTDGKPLPTFSTVLGEAQGLLPKIRDAITSRGIALYYEDHLAGGAIGLSEGKRIGCKTRLTPADEFHTLAHELAHELLHRGERRHETTRRTRELEAEAVAYAVCSGVGLDAKRASTDYIHLYQGDINRLSESLEHIRRAATEILSSITAPDESDEMTEARDKPET
jgi:hypothetical protein